MKRKRNTFKRNQQANRIRIRLRLRVKTLLTQVEPLVLLILILNLAKSLTLSPSHLNKLEKALKIMLKIRFRAFKKKSRCRLFHRIDRRAKLLVKKKWMPGREL